MHPRLGQCVKICSKRKMTSFIINNRCSCNDNSLKETLQLLLILMESRTLTVQTQSRSTKVSFLSSMVSVFRMVSDKIDSATHVHNYWSNSKPLRTVSIMTSLIQRSFIRAKSFRWLIREYTKYLKQWQYSTVLLTSWRAYGSRRTCWRSTFYWRSMLAIKTLYKQAGWTGVKSI